MTALPPPRTWALRFSGWMSTAITVALPVLTAAYVAGATIWWAMIYGLDDLMIFWCIIFWGGAVSYALERRGFHKRWVRFKRDMDTAGEEFRREILAEKRAALETVAAEQRRAIDGVLAEVNRQMRVYGFEPVDLADAIERGWVRPPGKPN